MIYSFFWEVHLIRAKRGRFKLFVTIQVIGSPFVEAVRMHSDSIQWPALDSLQRPGGKLENCFLMLFESMIIF